MPTKLALIISLLLHVSTTNPSPFTLSNTTTDLVLTGSNLPVLHKNSLHDLPNLRSAHLDLNNVTSLEEGAFTNLPNLYELHLSRNLLRTIPPGVFNRLNLRHLYLDRNNISQVHEDAFQNMTFLAFLQLEHNHLARINPEWFRNTPAIFTVLYNHNAIREVPAGAYRHFSRTLEVSVYLVGNEIERVDANAFEGLTRIGDVYLSGNAIRELNDTFRSAEYVRNVHLDYNRMECLSEGFKMTRVLESVNVEGNPVKCDCLADAQYWTRIHNVTLVFDENKSFLCSINFFSGD